MDREEMFYIEQAWANLRIRHHALYRMAQSYYESPTPLTRETYCQSLKSAMIAAGCWQEHGALSLMDDAEYNEIIAAQELMK